ncbi:MAG: hypothetical protein PHC43_07365 [Candidatus Marinimicrobia bacterium]|jgi:hypothetical protein|nr:hypothetical protein [Candidatus Neomarinimicrobiota bacterium]
MTKYRPEMLKASEIATKSGIDYSTVLRWAKEKKIESERIKLKNARLPVTLINLYSFTNYVRKHYRYHKMNTRAGKRWNIDEIKNPKDRTRIAIRVKKCRLRKIELKHEKRK